ncbi:MAG: thyX [Marmoricola sp.]|nr:thyX [Marmoricola sp.]
MITEPKITLLGTTHLVSDWAEDSEYNDLRVLHGGPFDLLPAQEGTSDIAEADYLAEFAGRACYQSFDRPNPKTASTADYLDHILEVAHYSVLSHASCSFYIEGVSRSLSLELIRSRFLAFSQLSQRYVDSSQMDWVVPPIFLQDGLDLEERALIQMENHFQASVAVYEDVAARLEHQLREAGISGTERRKRAREAARAVLPNDTETKLVCSGNMRAWRDFIAQRWTVHADLEIQRLAGVLLHELIQIAPGTFADFDPSAPAS